jgi:hypothetical protein
MMIRPHLNTDGYISEKGTAHRLDVPRHCVLALAASGRLHPRAVGGLLLYRRIGLMACGSASTRRGGTTGDPEGGRANATSRPVARDVPKHRPCKYALASRSDISASAARAPQ